MTEDQRIGKLEDRVSKIEDDVWDKLDCIDKKLSALAISFASRRECPSPGACIDLSHRIVRLEATHDTLAKTVADLIRWRAWLTGVNLVVSSITLLLLGVACNYIIKHL